MPKKLISLIALLVTVQFVVPGTPWQARAQAPAAPYPVAAPLDQYLIPEKTSEIELARSAAPASISDGAEVLVLSQQGYTTAVKGSNGFVCLVERSWAKSTDDPEFWNPKVQAPHCLNAPAAKTYLPIVLLKTKLVLAGKSKTEIAQTLKAALDKKELPTLEPNAMCYMMSKQQYLSDDDTHWHPHMMWYVPGDATQSWGANLAGVPTIAGNVPEDRMTIFLLRVGHWSDGTLAPQDTH
ncbi:hypothetical protein [Tunturiibacter gelidoferens]|uniref:Uncharacterized protein n=1 Tax=Tunturiibacter lichenicola TaxID=2051959 RepID=A0A7Y9NP43_9BACT|nr:hypothetical protein [Edaphobacter lichenicola]NYF52953.1 hypothetical protein [Edaphobacter lichenicola]